MKYFIFAMLFILTATEVKAQGFFIPNGALTPSVDRIKPLDEDVEAQLSDYSQRRYKVIDGRVIALPNEPTVDLNNPPDIAENQPTQPSLPKQKVVPNTIPEHHPAGMAKISQPKPEKKISVQEPQIETSPIIPEYTPNPDMPAYKTRYSQYLQYLKEFQNTGTLPKNDELNKMLRTMSSPHEQILFDGDVK